MLFRRNRDWLKFWVYFFIGAFFGAFAGLRFFWPFAASTSAIPVIAFIAGGALLGGLIAGALSDKKG